MRRSSPVVAVVATLALLCLVACGRKAGADVAAPTFARRIVSLAPNVTEALFAIGAGDRVVGRSRFCDFPPEARSVPVVGDVSPDLEAVLELRPDLVVGVAGLSSERLGREIGARHVPSWFPDTNSLAAIDALILGLGERTGKLDAARTVVRALDGREDAIARALVDQPKPRAVLVVAVAPVVAAGPNGFADELMRRAGVENAVREGGAWPRLGFEQLAELDPDVILDGTVMGQAASSLISPDRPGWSGLRAVRSGRVILLHDERILRPGPRIAEGIAQLASLVHPGAALP